MSYWSHNSELYNEIIFKEMVARRLANEDDDPEIVVPEFMKKPDSWKLASNAEANYWGNKVDEVHEREKNRRINK